MNNVEFPKPDFPAHTELYIRYHQNKDKVAPIKITIAISDLVADFTAVTLEPVIFQTYGPEQSTTTIKLWQYGCSKLVVWNINNEYSEDGSLLGNDK